MCFLGTSDTIQMARKLSFSVESILNDHLPISTSIYKNDSCRNVNNLVTEERPIHGCAVMETKRLPSFHQRSYSTSVDVPIGLQRLATPPSSPLSVASAPSPTTLSFGMQYTILSHTLCCCIYTHHPLPVPVILIFSNLRILLLYIYIVNLLGKGIAISYHSV